METRRNLRQETIRPQLFFKVLSKEIINPFHLSRLRTNHHKQIDNPIYQNTVKPTDVWTADNTKNKTFSLTMLC